ncbi:MAG: outer membrane beta-barrel protein [SAR324 cluster bacterium]|nr:outer membrane beta-barrel protein [SAR324 cluster bacterium]MCZ6729107.1 outer membrane beta-barrel protein [SAR324 cluster bacterium]MCZ6843848.1 outer membrane beta-barrel protein [SAR324 cluster bacterium]
MLTAAAAPLWAAQGDTRLGLFFGSTSMRAGGKTTTGSALGVGWGLEISEALVWSIAAIRATTDATETVAGQEVRFTADTTTLQTGLTRFFRNSRSFVPFVGAGLSVASYDVDFSADPNSEIGSSSGTAGGVFARAGFEFRMSPSFTIIPQYQFSAHSIRNDQGGSSTLVSDGLLLTLRLAV